MLFSRTRTALTRQARHYREWRDWDIVLEIEQREGDPRPAFASSASADLVDWGDGEPPVQYARSTATSTLSSMTVRTAPHDYAPGTYTIKIRVERGYYNVNKRVILGALNTGGTYTAKMPQLARVLKLDLGEVADSQNMFCKCARLEECCPVSGTRGLRNATSMYYQCYRLGGELALGDLSACTNCAYMCYGCASMVSLALGDLSACTNCSSMCYGCASMVSLTLGDLSALTNIYRMCYQCYKLEDVEIHADAGLIYTANEAFSGCHCLRRFTGAARLRASGEGTASTEKFSNIFNGCRRLEDFPDILPPDGFERGARVTLQNLCNDCRMMRGTAPSWLWDTSDPRYTAITTPTGMFSNCFFLSLITSKIS